MPEKKTKINKDIELNTCCCVEEKVDKDEQIRRLKRELEWARRERRREEERKDELIRHVDALVAALAIREERCRNLLDQSQYDYYNTEDMRSLCGDIHHICNETYRYDDNASKPVKAFAKKILDILERR